MDALLRSIYLTDVVAADVAARDLSAHIVAAASRNKVVPLALVLCKVPAGSGVVEAAVAKLGAQPVLRTLVSSLSSS